MNTLPDLSQLTHEQLLEFRQLALQHQSLAQSNQELDAKVQHLSVLTQKYEHELALFKSINSAVKRTSHRKTNPSVGRSD